MIDNKEQPYRQYFNDAQYYSLAMNTRDEVIVAGRGVGKGAIQARRLQSCFQGMPGSMGGFVAPSVKRCLTNILPSMLIHLERWGFKRDLHYVVGKKPWKRLHWKTPIFTPANWENTISFYNGSVCNVISQDRSGTSNSMSLDYLIIDEAKFIDYEQLKDETFQANRGNEMYFKNFPLHHGMTITSDMPITKKGSWFLSYKDKQDPELVKVIEGIIFQIWKLKQKLAKRPELHDAINKRLDELNAQLNFFRSNCLLYKEYSSIENLALLGEEFIRRAKRDLPPLTFATSIMCQRVGVSADGFYGGLREDVNLYTAPNESVLNLHTLDNAEGGIIPNDCRMDADCDDRLPLLIAFDSNNLINWLVVGQVKDGKLRIIKSFFVKYSTTTRPWLAPTGDFTTTTHIERFSSRYAPWAGLSEMSTLATRWDISRRMRSSIRCCVAEATCRCLSIEITILTCLSPLPLQEFTTARKISEVRSWQRLRRTNLKHVPMVLMPSMCSA